MEPIKSTLDDPESKMQRLYGLNIKMAAQRDAAMKESEERLKRHLFRKDTVKLRNQIKQVTSQEHNASNDQAVKGLISDYLDII